MERILGTPVSISRTDKELRVTIVFHTEEKLQEFSTALGEHNSPLHESFLAKAKRFFF